MSQAHLRRQCFRAQDMVYILEIGERHSKRVPALCTVEKVPTELLKALFFKIRLPVMFDHTSFLECLPEWVIRPHNLEYFDFFRKRLALSRRSDFLRRLLIDWVLLLGVLCNILLAVVQNEILLKFVASNFLNLGRLWTFVILPLLAVVVEQSHKREITCLVVL